MAHVMTKLALLALVLLVGSLGPACSQREANSKGQVEKITISTLPIGNAALLLIAQAKGFFRGNGLEVTLKFFPTGPLGLAQLQAGQIDVALMADFVLVNGIYKGLESLRCLSSIAAVDNIQVMARKDQAILQPSDLKGKKVGVSKGTIAEFFLGRFLTFHSLSLRNVESVDLRPADLAPALADGRVEAVTVWEPWVYEIKRRMEDKIVGWSGQTGQKYYYLIVSTDQLIKTRPVVLERMLRALNQAEGFMQSNMDASLEVIAQQLKFDKSVFRTEWLRSKYGLLLDQSLLITMEDEGRWIINNGLTDKKTLPNYLNYIAAEVLHKVKPQAVSMIIPQRRVPDGLTGQAE